MDGYAAAPPEHTDAVLAAPDEPAAPAAPVLADAAPRRSGRAPKPKDRLDPGLEAKKPQWDTTSTERNRARAEARNAAEDTPVEEHVADADEDESAPASPVAESSDDEETLEMLRAILLLGALTRQVVEFLFVLQHVRVPDAPEVADLRCLGT